MNYALFTVFLLVIALIGGALFCSVSGFFFLRAWLGRSGGKGPREGLKTSFPNAARVFLPRGESRRNASAWLYCPPGPDGDSTKGHIVDLGVRGDDSALSFFLGEGWSVLRPESASVDLRPWLRWCSARAPGRPAVLYAKGYRAAAAAEFCHTSESGIRELGGIILDEPAALFFDGYAEAVRRVVGARFLADGMVFFSKIHAALFFLRRPPGIGPRAGSSLADDLSRIRAPYALFERKGTAPADREGKNRRISEFLRSLE